MAVRTVVLQTGSGPDRPAASGEIRIRRFNPGSSDDGTYIFADDVQVALTLPASSVDLEVGEYFWFTPVRPRGNRILALIPAGSGSILFKDLVPVDPSSLSPLASPLPAWFTDLSSLVAAHVSDGSALDTAISAKVAALGGKPLTDVAGIASANAALVVGKHNPVDSTGASRTMTIANASAAGQLISVEKTDSSANTVTISGNLRGSASTIVLSYLRETLLLLSKADGSWWPIAGHRTKSSIDTQVAADITGKQDTATLNTDVAATVTTTGATQTAVDARAAVAASPRGRTFQGRQLQPCTARFPIIAAGIQSDGVKLTADTETHWPITRDVLSASIVFSNLLDFSSSTANGNNITVRAGVKIGTLWMPVFFNGRRDVVIEPDAMVISDPVGGPIAAGASLSVRTRVTVASGEKWVNNTLTDNADSEGLIYDTTDKTTNAGTITVQRAYSPAPFTILGEPARAGSTAKRTLVGIGDSIMQQAHDSINASVSATSTLAWGFVRRWAHVQKVPFINTGVIGDTAQGYASTGGRKYTLRRVLSADAAVAISDFGANDLIAGRTLAQIQADLLKIWTDMSAIGIEVWQTTITPNTTSTDTWATTGNQTVKSFESIRTALNDWIRTKPSPLTGYIETADAVETSRNSGIWKAAYTDDGLHPVIVGHAAMAATIPNTII